MLYRRKKHSICMGLIKGSYRIEKAIKKGSCALLYNFEWSMVVFIEMQF